MDATEYAEPSELALLHVPDPKTLHLEETIHRGIDYYRAIVRIPELPRDEQIVLTLHFGIGCPELSVKRIAHKLGKSECWASARLQRGLLTLRTMLSGSA